MIIEVIPLTQLIANIHNWMSGHIAFLQTVPPWLVVLGGLGLGSFIITQFAAVTGGILTFFERRVAGRIQYRVGPNRVGPQGILQFLADGLKLVTKEDLIPDEADHILFRLAPYLVVVGSFMAFVCLPFSSAVILTDLNVGILFILSITSIVVIGIIMSGWASNSKWSILGALRSAAQIISYEIPTGICVLNVVMVSGTLSMQGIIKAQGALPWEWNVFQSPFLLVSFFILFASMLAEINRTPFDIPEAESELVSGYNTEYSGIRFGLFFMAEFANVYLISGIAVTLFLGGWQLPAFGYSFIQGIPGSIFGIISLSGIALFLAEFATFFVKAAVLMFVILQLRWTLPRLRVDQLMVTCWKYLVPIAFFNVIATAFWMKFWPKGVFWMPYLLCALMAFVIFRYIANVVKNLKAFGDDITLNPLS